MLSLNVLLIFLAFHISPLLFCIEAKLSISPKIESGETKQVYSKDYNWREKKFSGVTHPLYSHKVSVSVTWIEFKEEREKLMGSFRVVK